MDIVRATLESMAYQIYDLVEVMKKDAGVKMPILRVDGGACANNFLLQFQSDIMGTKVRRPKVIETTSLGAAYLAGLATGYWKNKEEIAENWQLDKTFEPKMTEEKRSNLISGWHKAIERSRSWEE